MLGRENKKEWYFLEDGAKLTRHLMFDLLPIV